MRPSASKLSRRIARPSTSYYLERAMLLWPRLDRAKIRKVADDPERIAAIVERRTSQPFAAILAMLTRSAPAPASPTDDQTGFEASRPDLARLRLRIVHREESKPIQAQKLLPA
ncbi:MAG: hypothetical protein ACHQ01_02000 [Candidatus Limnocylindrales bacterium]